jgi:hypothetical protein
MPGDPAKHVIGTPEEQPASRHAPLPPKPPRKPTAKSILASVKWRRQELEPLVEEYRALAQADEVLKDI